MTSPPATSTTDPLSPHPDQPAVCLNNACVAFGDRVLWDHVDVDIAPGEFVAVLGPNGAGKTTLLRVLLGQVKLAHGHAEICGLPVEQGSPLIGYVPQQKTVDPRALIRGRDLVGFGLDGDKWGIGWPDRQRRKRIDEALDQVGASSYANAPLSELSGGEQQRLRIAQALVTRPRVLLCDEPLLSLDQAHQYQVTELIHRMSTEFKIAVVFVTHELTPVMPYVDRVLYFAGGRATIGTPEEVMTSQTLTDLYGHTIEVIRHRDQFIVVGAPDQEDGELHAHELHGHELHDHDQRGHQAEVKA